MAQATLSDMKQQTKSEVDNVIDWIVTDSVATCYLRMDNHYAEFEEYDAIKSSEGLL